MGKETSIEPMLAMCAGLLSIIAGFVVAIGGFLISNVSGLVLFVNHGLLSFILINTGLAVVVFSILYYGLLKYLFNLLRD